MATAFQSINVSLGPRDHKSDATTPTTPRAPFDNPARNPPPTLSADETGSTTPTRQSFAESNGKRALPTSPLESSFPSQKESPRLEEQGTQSRDESTQSTKSGDDIDMSSTISDGEEGSDGESVDGADGRPSKKKKGQRFYCTDYPPCNLSFTRSEHLARHIRKHTGERPFQCHCARRFSRLDNLRQHAQTVHVNEDIPGDSLAATGTRFQRQIRTDRVRPQGQRSRASTAGSTGSHGRGHSRNLSTSSITSTTSTMSTISNLSSMSNDSPQRRPLMMAERSPRSRLTIDTMKASPQAPYGFGNASPSGATTPTSVAYSNGPASPFGSSLGSPMPQQRHSGYWGDRTPGRRLSVPSGANPFQPSSGNMPGVQYFSPRTPSNASHDSASSSMVTSPTSSIHSFSRQDSISAAEAESRRRTWHPSTYSNFSYQQRPATSGLIFQQTPDAPRPAFAPQPVASAASQPQRLPGFETFDQISQRPPTPPRHPNHQLETHSRPILFPASSSERSLSSHLGHRRGTASWDLSLHQNLTKLDIHNNTPPKEFSTWGNQVTADIQNAGNNTSQARPVQIPRPLQPPPKTVSQDATHRSSDPENMAAKQRPVTPQRSQRPGGFYGAPAALYQIHGTHRTSPEDSSSSEGVPTPSTTSLDYQPSIIHANGYIEPQPAAGHGFQNHSSQAHQQIGSLAHKAEQAGPSTAPNKPDLSGLEALVAAATSEDKSR